MVKLRLLASSAVMVVVTIGVAHAQAQDYPKRPIRFILPYPPGGVTDVVARIISQKMTESLGQQIIIDQRGGGASIVGTALAANAAPDGYTLLLGTFGFAITPALYEKLPYDTVRDFSAVSLVANGSLALVAHPSLPVHSVKELIAAAKARPGQLNYGSTGGGSSSSLGAALFQSLTGVRMTGINYKGQGPSLTALLSGEVNLIFAGLLPTVQHVKNGRLRALGVSAAKRSNVMPEVPTIAEAGVSGYELTSWYGVLVPSRTPPPIVTKLNSAVVGAVQSADAHEKMIAQGLEPATSTPSELTRYIAAEVAKWSKVVKQIGVVPD